MKKLKEVLFITTEDSYLFVRNETICVKIGGLEKAQIPSHTVESIVCFGNTTVSTPFIAFCSERNIILSFHSPYGKFYGRIHGAVSGNVLLRKKQYEVYDNIDISVHLVKNILYGKILNSKNILLKASREHNDDLKKEELRRVCNKLAEFAVNISEINDIDSLRGLEGTAASEYFSVFDNLIKIKSSELTFDKRTKHPPENNVNALLSFIYMLLKNDVQSALESVGLDPACGYLHRLRPGRASLALDLMEELRSPLCDRFAVSLINLKIIQDKDFESSSGAILLNDEARKKVLTNWQKRKKESVEHSFLKEKIEIGLIPYAQAMLLARFFRGDLDQYPPFIWRC